MAMASMLQCFSASDRERERESFEVAVISLYLRTGEELSSSTNAKILGEVAAMAKDLAIPWPLVADFNCDVMKGEVIAAHEATILNRET